MSITMDTTLASLVTNKRRVSALKSLGIVTVGDALTYYPFNEATNCRMALRLSGLRCGDAFGRTRRRIAGWRCAYPAYDSRAGRFCRPDKA